MADEETIVDDLKGNHTLLEGKWLLTARFIWFLIAISSLILFFTSLPVVIDQINEVSTLAFESTHEIYTPDEFNVFMRYTYLFRIPFAVPMLVSSLIALVIFWLRSNDWMAILVSSMLFTVGIAITVRISGLTPVPPVLRLLANILSFFDVASVIIFPFVFPNGRFVPKWTRYFALIWWVWILVWFIFPTAPVIPTQWPAALEILFYLFWFFIVLYSPIYRHNRVVNSDQRQQTKWVVRGIVLTPVGVILSAAILLIATLILVSAAYTAVILFFVSILTFLFSLVLVPVCIGVSVIRYRLWGTGFIIKPVMEI